MLNYKLIITVLLCMLCRIGYGQEKTLIKEDFAFINLNYKGLERVRQSYEEGNYADAAAKLLAYYRKSLKSKNMQSLLDESNFFTKRQINKADQEKADKALIHHFQPHKGYSFFDYGKDINWQYWPVKDNEVRWQLHRVTWWQSMAIVYNFSKDEKYALEWIAQFRDWCTKNPLGLSEDNDQYAWRPLEISERIQSLPATLAIFIDSPNFTPGFLMEFLKSYHQQADYIPKHYSAIGNHLLFEGERIIKAGCVFPEFKEADFWRKSGIKVLNNEIQKQVFEDGMQFELSPSYHNASINIFLRALSYTQSVGLDSEFPASYKLTVEKMILATINFSFPDYSFPMFGDAWLNNKSNMIKLFTNWSRSFPNNPIITYFASDRKEGIKPSYLSKPLRNGGFYTFRNGWESDATVMVVKAGPKGFFHAQPDNGTFELWVKGRNFMPDAGCYVYSGDEQIMKMRDWFRQTKVHQTLTLDNKNMETTDANLLKWETSATQDLLSYENPSYSNLKHIRSIAFVDKTFFVILDKAVGLENGTVGIHFQVVENSNPVIKKSERKIYTQFADGNNLIIQNLDPEMVPKLVTEEGKVSYKYREEIPRPAFAFEKAKQQESIEFISVVLPFKGLKAPIIKLAKKQIKNGVTILNLIVNSKNYEVKL